MDLDSEQQQQLGQQSSIYRGVTFNKKSRKWQSVLNVSGSHVHLGTFNSEEDAAVAFDKAALIVRGERARINFALQNYMDGTGRIIEDPVYKSKIESSCDPNRTKRRPPAPRGPGPHTSPAAVSASLASISPYIQQLQAQLTAGAGAQPGLPPYSLWSSPQQQPQLAAAAAAAAAGVAAFGLQQQQQAGSGPGFPAGKQDAQQQLSTQSMLQMLSSFAPSAAPAAAASPTAASGQGALPGLSALSLPSQAPAFQHHHQQQLSDALLGRTGANPLPPSSALYAGVPDAAAPAASASQHMVSPQDAGPAAMSLTPASLQGFWDVITAVRRSLPEDAELQSVLPCKTGQVGVMYSLAGHWGACLLHGNTLTGHHVRSNMNEAMEYLMAVFAHLAQPGLQGLMGGAEQASAADAGAGAGEVPAEDGAAAAAAAAEAAAVAAGNDALAAAAHQAAHQAADASTADALQSFVALQALLAAATGGGGGASAGLGAATASQQQQLQDQQSLSALQALLNGAGGAGGIAATVAALQGTASSLDSQGLMQLQRLAMEAVQAGRHEEGQQACHTGENGDHPQQQQQQQHEQQQHFLAMGELGGEEQRHFHVPQEGPGASEQQVQQQQQQQQAVLHGEGRGLKRSAEEEAGQEHAAVRAKIEQL